MRFAVLSATALALSFSLQAQTGSVAGSRLIGLTSSTPLVVTQDPSTCSATFCAPAGFPSAASPLAGGTAYDAHTRGVWISDGKMLAKVDLRDRCRYQCRPVNLPLISISTVVTGLAYDDVHRHLWASTSNNEILTFDVRSCSISLIRRCVFPVAPGHTVSGLATDDAGKLIFIATSAWSGPSVTPGGVVYVSKMSSACRPFCKQAVQSCQNRPLRPLTGLGYDGCRKLVWVTDGSLVSGLSVDISQCTLREKQCCKMPLSTETYIGLCITPGTERSAGRSCTNGACPTCPQLRHELGGDPVIGNALFSLDLIDAPAHARAWLVLNAGPCQPTGPIVPPFCGRIMVPLGPLPPIVPAAVSTGGSTGCTGNAQVALPVPVSASLCGVEFSTQYIGICPQVVMGTFVSNCLTWTVSSS